MNSKLFYNEEGRVELNGLRPCRQKVCTSFELPATPVERAQLFIQASKDEPETALLQVCVGGEEYSVEAPVAQQPCWLRCAVEPSVLQSGENTIEIPPQPGWSVAFDSTSSAPIIRLSVDGEVSDEVLWPRYGDVAIEAQREEWLSLLPHTLHTLQDRWQWYWQLAGYLSCAWKYANVTDDTTVYAPWDARTILKWGRAGRDDSGNKPIVMCVHYGVCFVQFCIALGIPARAVVLTPELNSPAGHFVAEVWLEQFHSWAMIDPNMHLCYRDKSSGRPLSVAELSECGHELHNLAQFGEGWKNHRKRFANWVEQYYFSGAGYRMWGVWARHDWIANPQLAPIAHGATAYAETDIIWCSDNENTRNALAMFPHFLSSNELALPPVAPEDFVTV